MLILDNGLPGVALSASDEFLSLTPIERVSLLIAVVQLCGTAMAAIAVDHPEDELDIKELMEMVAIQPENKALN